MQGMQETGVQSLSQEDPPGRGDDNPHQYSCLKNSMDKGLESTVLQRVRHDGVAEHSTM